MTLGILRTPTERDYLAELDDRYSRVRAAAARELAHYYHVRPFTPSDPAERHDGPVSPFVRRALAADLPASDRTGRYHRTDYGR